MAETREVRLVFTGDNTQAMAAIEELATAAEAIRSPRVEIISEPLTYRRDVQDKSFFRDYLLTDKVPGAPGRLERHGQEMRKLGEAREKAAISRLNRAGIEYRIEPNRTDGTGGYFSPPAWLNEFFATGKHAERVLADLIKACGGAFPLPAGVSQVNVPILGDGGTLVQPAADNVVVPDKGITDSAGTGNVVSLEGMADVALQLLELSPLGAALDWVIFKDMKESYDADLESQLIAGTGNAATGGGDNQLLGVINVPSITSVSYTDASPTGPEMWPTWAQAASQLADARSLPPECWLMRYARYAWLSGQEDNSNRPLGLPSPFFLGNTDDTPDPVTGLYGKPLFTDEAIPVNLGTGLNQDIAIVLRPSDLMLFEGDFQTSINRVPLAGSLGVRLVMHNYVAAITNRFPTAIATVGGTGFVVQSNY